MVGVSGSIRKVQQQLRLRGLAVAADAVKLIAAYVDSSGLLVEDALDNFIAELDRQQVNSTVIGLEAVQSVLDGFTGTSGQEGQQSLKVISAFETPQLCFDPVRKTFSVSPPPPSVTGEAAAKVALYRDRLTLLRQRFLRDKLFDRPCLGLEGSGAFYYELTPVQSLSGASAPGRKYVMGALSQLQDGVFFLEDHSGAVALDLSETLTTAGFFTENCIVVCAGDPRPGGTFKVAEMGFPPMESARESRQLVGDLDYFGRGTALTAEMRVSLEKREKAAESAMFVVISDLWVDNDAVLEKFGQVLDGFESLDTVPSCFLLLGNFCSRPCNLAFSDFAGLRSRFRMLGKMIAARQRIREGSQFIFVPGPGDPGPTTALPRPPLPKYFSQEVLDEIPSATFTSNPCRLQFFAQELVVFREDLQYRMRRGCIVPPTMEETAEPFHHLVVTLLQQSHLCPMPLTTQPVVWELDHALRLYPVPDALILGDRSQQAELAYEGVTCFNSGSFAHDNTFAVYRPASREVELSGV